MTTRQRELIKEARSAMRRLSAEIDGLDQRTAEHFKVGRTDVHIIDTVESRGPITATELAHAVGLTTGGLSIALERLEQIGYLRRVRHPDDRRKVMVEVTDAIVPLQKTMFAALGRRMQAILRGYTEDQLATIVDFLDSAAAAIGAAGLDGSDGGRR
jgi:DNA-binding MarR family transcriptional regulator